MDLNGVTHKHTKDGTAGCGLFGFFLRRALLQKNILSENVGINLDSILPFGAKLIPLALAEILKRAI